MNTFGRSTLSAVFSIALAYAVATCVSVAVLSLWMLDWELETAGVGLLLATAVLPAIACSVVVSRAARLRHLRVVAFLTLGLPMPLYLLSIVLFSSEQARTEAADQWALAFLIPLTAASVAAYATIVWRERKGT